MTRVDAGVTLTARPPGFTAMGAETSDVTPPLAVIEAFPPEKKL